MFWDAQEVKHIFVNSKCSMWNTLIAYSKSNLLFQQTMPNCKLKFAAILLNFVENIDIFTSNLHFIQYVLSLDHHIHPSCQTCWRLPLH